MLVRRLFSFFIFLSLICIVGCATDEPELNPNIPAGAYAAEGFTFYVEPPIHDEWKPVKFYFKNCELSGFGNHFSKTEYECTYP